MYKLADEMTWRAPSFAAYDPRQSDGKEAFAHDVREPYQRDLGRIVHSSSFRRLQAKTQVMGVGEGDFHRTRLTHSMEVAQIGRSIVWQLTKQTARWHVPYLPTSELMEAICYAHDLGHPPYGHGGEVALQSCMAEYGGFEGNAQTLRILTRLEKMFRHEGIRPTRRLVLGVLKYPVAYGDYPAQVQGAKPPKCHYNEDRAIVRQALSCFTTADAELFCSLGENGKPRFKSLDCSIMELADDIAYGVHDLEDGVARRILTRNGIESDLRAAFAESGISLIRNLTIDDFVRKLFSGDGCERKHAISLLVGLFVLDAKLEERRKFASPLLDLKATLPDGHRRLLDALSNRIMKKHVISGRQVQTLEFKGRRIVRDLFEAFAEQPTALVGKENISYWDARVPSIEEEAARHGGWRNLPAGPDRNAVARAICDFIAGMTDPYAEKYHRRLFEPGYGSSTDEL